MTDNNEHDEANVKTVTSFINDDHGTFFYKLRNGSMPFEYGVEDKLDSIRDILLTNNQDITCGLISAIIADGLKSTSDYFDNTVWFIIFLLSSFIILKIVVYIAIKIAAVYKKKKRKIEKEPTDKVDIKIQEWFYKKIIVEAEYVFSVVNRSAITNKEKDKKYNLKKMYALQGKYEILRICSEMIEVLITNKKDCYTKSLVFDIGKDAFSFVISTLEECKETIKNGPFKLDCRSIEGKIKRLKNI